MVKRRFFSALIGCLAGVGWAAGPSADRIELAQAREARAATASASGVIRNIDRANSRITIDHGPIPAIGMPGMTMTFKVTEPKLLDQVRQGDQVNFELKQSGLGWIVTNLDRK
jgi:Cu/Ag efflux protein CusF